MKMTSPLIAALATTAVASGVHAQYSYNSRDVSHSVNAFSPDDGAGDVSDGDSVFVDFNVSDSLDSTLTASASNTIGTGDAMDSLAAVLNASEISFSASGTASQTGQGNASAVSSVLAEFTVAELTTINVSGFAQAAGGESSIQFTEWDGVTFGGFPPFLFPLTTDIVNVSPFDATESFDTEWTLKPGYIYNIRYNGGAFAFGGDVSNSYGADFTIRVVPAAPTGAVLCGAFGLVGSRRRRG